MILSFMKQISLYFYQKLFNQRYNSDFYFTQYLLTKARHNAFILNKKKTFTPIPERAYTCNLLLTYVTLIFCSIIQNAKVNHFLPKIIK